MAEVLIEAGTLLANAEDRTVSGLLLPYGEVGNTNLGKFSIDRGVVKLPRDASVVGANTDHAREFPVGRATKLEDTDAGVVATFKIADTDEGDALLAEIADGKRSNLSAEVRNIVLRAGKAVSGVLFGAAFVAKGAFPSASLMAADVGETPADQAPATPPAEDAKPLDVDKDGSVEIATTTTPDVVNVHPADTATPVAFTQKEENVTNATVPETLQAAAPVAPEALSKHEALTLLAAKANGTAPADALAKLKDGLTEGSSLFAALTPVKHGGATGAVAPYDTAPAWIGEIWDGNTAKPVVSDLLGAKALTSRQVSGFKFTTEPTGGDWAGNGAAVTSTAIATTTTTYTASYWAGANTFSREFTDFGVSEPLLSHYFDVQTRNFTLWLDDKALTSIQGGAQIIEADNPSGLSIGAGFSALIDGAAQVITNTGTAPTFALVDSAIYKSMLKTPQSDILGYLNAALGLSEGDLSGFKIRPVPTASMDGNSVIVGVSQGADVYTLAGSPVRAEALQVATGQIDVGLYGYGLVVPNLAHAFVGVTAYVAA